MIVYPLANNFVRLYSKGIEKEYKGKYIVYEDSTITFLFFYYSTFTKVYVINGIKDTFQLVQVQPKINLICRFNGKEARRFIKFFNYIYENDKTIFYYPPLFFRECYILIGKKKYMSLLTELYLKYKKEMKEKKIVYPEI